MDIKITNEAGLTKPFYEVDSQLAAILVFAGIARPIAKPSQAQAAPAVATTEWFVHRLPQSGTLAITCKRPGGESISFTGDPAKYKIKDVAGNVQPGLSYCDSYCPPEVLADYARRFGAPEVAGSIEAFMAAARQTR